jgi:hypothetical protein
MRFLQVVDSVKNQLSAYSLQEKAQIFKDVLHCPITITDGIFYVSSKLYPEHRMKDYLSIREHWMNMHEFDRLFNYFENLKKNDK